MTSESVIVWADCPVLQSVSGKMGGEWVFRGTDVPYWAVLDRIGKYTVDQIAAEYPSVNPDQIVELLDFIADSTEPDQERSATPPPVRSNSQ